MTLIIVDPDDQSATWLARILADMATQIIRTTSADEAMAAFATEAPDILGVVVGPGPSDAEALTLASRLQEAAPDVSVVMLRRHDSGELLRAAMRAGVRDVVTTVNDAVAVHGACARALAITRALRGHTAAGGGLRAWADPSRGQAGKVITVFSSKGGCGKTFLATNLAVALAADAEVALVDLDLHFGDVAIMLQLFPARTIQDAARASALDPITLKSFLTRHHSGVCALVAPSEPTVADTISPTTVVTILRLLRQRFGYVVVDTPAAFSDQVLAAFDESDAITMLATLDVPSIKNLKLALRTMETLHYPRGKTCLVINRADSKVGLRLPDVERILDTQIDVTLPSSRAVPLSINKGSPIMIEEPRSSVAEAVRELAEQLAATPIGRPSRLGRGRSRRSLFQRS